MPHPVYLVRHGESEWNVLRLTQGQTVHPRLTARGREQAFQAARAILTDLVSPGGRIGRVITSDLVRAVETAEIVLDAAAGDLRPQDVEYDMRLREGHLGELEGRSYDQTFAAAAEIDWSTPDVPIGGGETVRQVHDRMAEVLTSVRTPAGSPAAATVLISHGDAIRTALAHLGGVQPLRAPWVEVRNGAVARIDADNSVYWLTGSAQSAAPPPSADDHQRS